MLLPRRIIALVAATIVVSASMQTAPPTAAATAPATSHAAAPVHLAAARSVQRPHVADCTGPVALGTTTQCDFAAAGTASYQITVGTADRLRVRAAEQTSAVTPSITVRDAAAAVVCSHAGTDQFECSVGAGTLTVDVSVPAAATVYTTIDSVRAPGTCAASADLAVNAPGIDVNVTDPGASYCTYLPDAAAGDVLRFTFHSTADDPLRITIYNSAGSGACTAAPLFTAAECKVGDGSGFRMFVNWDDVFARSTVLYATRLSRPSGCPNAAPDSFGSGPTRGGLVDAFRVRCFSAPTLAGHPLAVHVVPGVVTRLLKWSLRSPAGDEVCTGDTTSGAKACPAPVDGRYALFVAGPTGSSGGPRTHVSVILAAALDSAGCTPLASTAFGAPVDLGTLSAPGQVDCRTFTGVEGHTVQITPWDLARYVGAMLVDPSGAAVCRFQFRNSCRLPAGGTYRVLVWADRTADPVDYRLWVTDLDSTAGCTATSADPFGVGPTRKAPINGDTVNACWTFHATKGAAYLVGVGTASGTLFTQLTMRAVDGYTVCQVVTNSRTGCHIPHTGTYELVVAPYSPQYDPAQQGVVRTGLWHFAQPSGCVAASTSFAAPPVEASFDAPDEVDCVTVTTTGAEVLTVNAGGVADLSVQHHVYTSGGRRLCLIYPGSDCRVHRADTYYVLTYSLLRQVTPYTLSVRSVTRHVGCPSATLRDFDTGPNRAFDVEPGVPACITYTQSAAFARVLLRVHRSAAAPRYALHDPGGKQICPGTLELQSCALLGSGTYVLVLSAATPTTGAVGFYSVIDSAGCDSTPSFGFDAAPVRGAIRRAGEVDCYDLGSAETKRTLRLAIASTPTEAVVHLALFYSSGHTVCRATSADYFRYVTCVLAPSVDARLLVWLDEGHAASTGRYAIHVWSLRNPTGCGQLGTAADGFGPLLGRFADPNDQNCYQFRAPPDTALTITVTNPDVPDSLPWLDILQREGYVACEINRTGQCTLSAGGTYTLLVFPRSGEPDFTGRYRIVAVRPGAGMPS